MLPIAEVASKLDLKPEDLLFFGEDKAKIRLSARTGETRGKLVLVSAMSPSPAGEGKTTTSIGLTDALNAIGKKTVVALREPSMGPVFGMKGGGTGGGRAQVYPPESINLHFTGDFHAVAAAHNLLAATVDNHMHHGNQLRLDPRRLLWNRVLDVNDRALRNVIIGLGGKLGGVPRESRFDITAASEIMAILALAHDAQDLRQRLGAIVVGFDVDGRPVQAREFKVEGSMVVLLKEAMLPNLAQTAEGNPAVIHAGPFANIAHGTSSVLGTQIALSRADLVVQEAGFGSDLGAEKFLNIFCRAAGVRPACVVVVVTLRGIRFHAGLPKSQISESNPEAIKKGLCNPLSHLKGLASFGIPVVAAINEMANDTEEELALVEKSIQEAGFAAARNRVFAEGSAGGKVLAEKVAELAVKECDFEPTYQLEEPLTQKIEKIVTGIYGGKGVDFAASAARQLKQYTEAGFGDSYICMAKTPYSFSDDDSAVGRPTDFTVQIREARLLAGARFVVPISGQVMTMPGLAKVPNLERIDLDADGNIQL